jgi:hypothetical protein
MSDSIPESYVDSALESRYALPVRTYPAVEWKRLERAGKAVDTMKR